jgi:membrane-bound lytic murein transglycosylase D
MVLKIYIIYFTSLLIPLLALEPKNFIQDDTKLLEELSKDKSLYMSSIKKFNRLDRFHYYASDPMNKIDDQFIIPNYFLARVHFWFNIYTLYTSSEVVVHDKDNLDLIYDILDYQKLIDSALGAQTKSSLRSQLSKDRINEIKKSLLMMSEGKATSDQKLIEERIQLSGQKLPKNGEESRKFYKMLSENVRAQTGQKNFIEQGVVNFIPYEEVLRQYFETFSLPFELASIPFLESSFNTKAKSKVGATGPWQFMDGTGKSFMVINNVEDQRVNPIIASIAALHLLSQNKKILKTWDLAVSAYNSGTKHYVLAKQKFKEKNINLEDILKYYDHPHIGFASSNFYSEFLALVHTLAYKDKIYNLEDLKKRSEFQYNSSKLKLFVSKCSFKLAELVSGDKNLLALNTHLLSSKNTYKRGTLVVSDQDMDPKKYLAIKNEELTKYYPKNYFKLLGKSRCGKI